LPGEQKENRCRRIQANDFFAQVLNETLNVLQNMENEMDDDAPSACTNVNETAAFF
jgi:hypothetical protein